MNRLNLTITVTSRLVTALFAYSVIATALSFFVPTYVVQLGSILIALPAAGVATLLWRRANNRLRTLSKSLSETSTKQLDELIKLAPAFSLYLRPLFVTGQILTDATVLWKLISIMTGGYLRNLDLMLRDLEVGITRINLPNRLLLSVAGDLAPLGAARIKLQDESNWREAIRVLVERAELIYVTPLDQPGVRWELEHIVNSRLLQRTLFIMPGFGYVTRVSPTISEDPTLADIAAVETFGHMGLRLISLAADRGLRLAQFERVDLESYWERSRSTFSELGLHLPPYRRTGAIFYFDERDEVTLLPLMLPAIRTATDLVKQREQTGRSRCRPTVAPEL
ncbi:hypothetical protein QTI66_00010 [Variovorax sp. J22R133]|uniref:hypothetical protein n=1 Tax=Variovorax brevis TaxID=3053503 RepID=UPI0025786E72|nr:hypothetical protein [Variovorax sp. J22R133]MDM0110515.1 hypothetical protein [Variovorax sp. J22R133]